MALRRMVLRDFVIVHELELELQGGYTALTGETGAGKSILIDALQLVTGARAEVGLIREGAQRTEISAEFDNTPLLDALLAEQGFAADDALLLRRSVDQAGKSRAWVNGSPATAQQLRAVGELLLDIHGQHAWQSLTRAAAVRELLDAYARVSTAALSGHWQRWQEARRQHAEALAAQSNLQDRRDKLLWQIGEVDKLQPQPDEWDSLNTEHARLSNGQALLDAAQGALDALDGDDGGALRRLAAACAAVEPQQDIESRFAEPVQMLNAALAQTEETVRSLRAYLRHVDLDPARLQELDTRMALWVSLARRYKQTPAQLCATWQQWKQELAQLDAASDLDALQAQVDAAAAAYETEARKVSKARAKAAPLLAQSITSAMQELGMRGGQFVVALERAAQPMESGWEEVQFLVAGHAGSTPRPVGKVASGGELSRIALAIAVSTSTLGSAPTLVFDEVDSGIGGAVAHTVGRLMQTLGGDRQVLAVTHLPQVAACANQHLVVAKNTHGNLVHSSVTPVEDDARVQEIARMLGGETLTPTTLAHAREMLRGTATEQ
jgi:DNA repair protein RecN (Recombination protein N)